MDKKQGDLRYDDFRLQIIIDSNCNLACEYCVLLYKNKVYKEERSISYQVLDKYIEFFDKNYEQILKYYKKINITFFGGEPLLSKEKIYYILDKLAYRKDINFVIHTNGILVDKKLLDGLSFFDKKRLSFIISIDGDLSVMMRYRLRNKLQFYKIIRGIKLLKEKKYKFLFSPSIMKPKGKDLFNNYKYLYKFKPDGIILNPVTAIYIYREDESTKEIVKGVKLFFDYLQYIKGLKLGDIIRLFGFPLILDEYKSFLKFGINITGDIDGTIHAMSFAWQGFDDGTTYNRKDLKKITLGNVIFNKEHLISNICRYGLYSDEEIWKVAYSQQRRWTLPDWDVQNLLAVMILKYFRNYFKNKALNNEKPLQRNI